MSVEPDDSKQFLKTVIQNKLATEEQVAECQELKEKYPDKTVGQILVAKRYLSPEHRAEIMKAISAKEAAAAASGRQPQAGRSGESSRQPAGKSGESSRQPGKKEPAEPSDTIGEPDTLDPANPRKNIVKLMKKAAELKASDLHINVGSPPMLRYQGRIVKLNMPPIPAEMSEPMMMSLLDDRQKAAYAEHLSLDFTYDLEGTGRFRANVFRQQKGVDGALRFIPIDVPKLADLGVPDVVEKMTHYTQGLTLITGPSGSGKTTTMAALIQLVNAARKENIVCLEEPIEYRLPSLGCNIIQREIPRDSLSFSNALRAALREDPDVIMIGDMRDRDTVSTAVTAAETGHLVLGTLHTSSAARTIDRILDVFPPREAAQVRAMISESLRGVCTQQLIPRFDGKGVVLACEIMFNTPAIANLIRESRTYQIPSSIQTGKKLGMQTMDDVLQEYVNRRLISSQEAWSRADNKSLFAP